MMASPGSHRSVKFCVFLVLAFIYSWHGLIKWPLGIQLGKSSQTLLAFLYNKEHCHVHPAHAQNLLQCLERATNLEDKDLFPGAQMLAQVNQRRQRSVSCTTARSVWQLLRWTRLKWCSIGKERPLLAVHGSNPGCGKSLLDEQVDCKAASKV